MAEILVFNKDHWMVVPSKNRPDLSGYKNVQQKIIADSELSLEQRTRALVMLDWKYEARYRRGDIIEIRKDGTGMVGKEFLSFCLIKVPISFGDAKEFCKVDMDGEMIKHHSKHWIDISQIVLDKNKEAIISVEEFNTLIKRKK